MKQKLSQKRTGQEKEKAAGKAEKKAAGSGFSDQSGHAGRIAVSLGFCHSGHKYGPYGTGNC